MEQYQKFELLQGFLRSQEYFVGDKDVAHYANIINKIEQDVFGGPPVPQPFYGA